MNWNQGLRRVNAVWWGLVLLLAAMFCIGAAIDSGRGNALIGFGYFAGSFGLCALIIYCCNKITNWVIDGFFKK